MVAAAPPLCTLRLMMYTRPLQPWDLQAFARALPVENTHWSAQMQASEASASTAAAHGGAFASGHTPASAAGGAAAARSRAPRRRCRHQRRLHAQLLDLGVLVGGHEALVGARDLLELLLRLLAVVCGRRATGGWVGGGKPAGPWERTA